MKKISLDIRRIQDWLKRQNMKNMKIRKNKVGHLLPQNSKLDEKTKYDTNTNTNTNTNSDTARWDDKGNRCDKVLARH